jgi:hypothetical protein
MSRIAKSHVNAAFEWAAGQITEAGGRDGVTSRAEIRHKIGELTGPERDLVDFFYRFILRQGAGASERVTRTDIEAALAVARAQLVAAFDTDNNGLAADEVAAMPLLGRLAVKVARRRSRSGEELAAHFEALAFSLVFDDYSTELHNERFLSFHAPVQLAELTAQTFRDALHLHGDGPQEAIARSDDAEQFFARLAEAHTPGQTAQAVALAQAMHSTLSDLRVYVVGQDVSAARGGSPIHPVYVVGLAPDGSIAGLRARVQWS